MRLNDRCPDLAPAENGIAMGTGLSDFEVGMGKFGTTRAATLVAMGGAIGHRRAAYQRHRDRQAPAADSQSRAISLIRA